MQHRLLFYATLTRCFTILWDLLKQNQIQGVNPSNVLKWELLTMSHLACFDHCWNLARGYCLWSSKWFRTDKYTQYLINIPNVKNNLLLFLWCLIILAMEMPASLSLTSLWQSSSYKKSLILISFSSYMDFERCISVVVWVLGQWYFLCLIFLDFLGFFPMKKERVKKAGYFIYWNEKVKSRKLLVKIKKK